MTTVGGSSGELATRYGSGPRSRATSPGRSRAASPASGTTHASPRNGVSTVSGARSRTSSDHGGSSTDRTRNAPRARAPSNNPVNASTAAA